jgi:uncharacterized protein involved in exopolysaccharide biosynthesis
VNTEIEHLKSEDFLEKVAEALPFSLAADTSTEDLGPLQSVVETVNKGVNTLLYFPSKLRTLFSAALSEDDLNEKKAESGKKPHNPSLWPLRLGLEALAVPNTALIEIAFSDRSPQRAATVVNTILDLYPAYRVKMYHDESAISFYDKQKQQLEREIADLEKQVDEFEAKENLSSVADQREQVLELLLKTEDRLKVVNASIDKAKARIDELERQLAKQPATSVASQDLEDPEARPLHESLVAKEIEKNELLQKYTEQDRRVRDKEQEIAAIKGRIAIAQGAKVIVGEHVSPNITYQTLYNDLIEQKVNLKQHVAEQDAYAEQVRQLKDDLDHVSIKGNELTRLQELLALKKEQFVLYSKKAEEARIADAMDKEKLTNVKAVDHAPVPSLPTPTKTALLVILAMFVGAGAGLGGALALEFLHPTFHSALDVERQLEIPVLALIPDLRAQGEKVKEDAPLPQEG